MKSKEVNQYIEKFDGEKKAILKKLRKIILKTFPKLKEELKWGTPWYGGFFYLVGLKDHVNMGFAFGGSLKKYEKELEGTGKYMRHIKIHSLKEIDEKKIVKLMKSTNKTCMELYKKGNKKK